MNRTLFAALAAVGLLAGFAGHAAETTLPAQTTVTGNISQNQSGRNNSQSIVIGGSAPGGTPSLTQSQTGANRKQSIRIEGKKVETKDE